MQDLSKCPYNVCSNGQTVFSISGVDYEVSSCSRICYAAYPVLTAQVDNRPPIRHLTPARIWELCNANIM